MKSAPYTSIENIQRKWRHKANPCSRFIDCTLKYYISIDPNRLSNMNEGNFQVLHFHICIMAAQRGTAASVGSLVTAVMSSQSILHLELQIVGIKPETSLFLPSRRRSANWPRTYYLGNVIPRGCRPVSSRCLLDDLLLVQSVRWNIQSSISWHIDRKPSRRQYLSVLLQLLMRRGGAYSNVPHRCRFCLIHHIGRNQIEYLCFTYLMREEKKEAPCLISRAASISEDLIPSSNSSGAASSASHSKTTPVQDCGCVPLSTQRVCLHRLSLQGHWMHPIPLFTRAQATNADFHMMKTQRSCAGHKSAYRCTCTHTPV